jgi:hypothetical protein
MVFKIFITATIRVDSKDKIANKIKKEVGEEFFDKYISIGDEIRDIGQEVDMA